MTGLVSSRREQPVDECAQALWVRVAGDECGPPAGQGSQVREFGRVEPAEGLAAEEAVCVLAGRVRIVLRPDDAEEEDD